MEDRTRLDLTLNEADFDELDPNLLERVRSVAAGEVILSEEAEAKQMILQALPSVVAKRLDKMVPPSFRVSQLQFGVSLGGKVGGFGIDGDVKVTLEPDPEATTTSS